jgi:hypothetical protein
MAKPRAVKYLGGLLFSILVLPVGSAYGVPSFARQTGLACSSCHSIPPELTPLGRLFKLNGYTMTGIRTITSKSSATKAGLNLNSWLPLSAFFQASDTAPNKPQPGTQSDSFEFPQDVSLFLAGAFSTHTGGYVQFTYTGQNDHFGWDNTDIRYANSTTLASKSLVYGITLNNNPTVEDLWNDTPAWGFPWVSPDSTVGPITVPALDGVLAQDVAGLGGYAMFDNHWYADATLYRSDHLGAPQPNPGTGFNINIQGVAPYWRLAWQDTFGNNYLEIGTYGLHLRSTPNGVMGAENSYTDVAADLQWERIFPKLSNDLLTVHGTYIHENSDLNAAFASGGASFSPHHLNTWRADGTWHFGDKYGATLGAFNTTGTSDPLLYAAAPVTGSASGSPKTSGYILQLAYWPVQNISLTLQYTGYWRFNGLQMNYDGAGRNAWNNNAVYTLVWFNF